MFFDIGGGEFIGLAILGLILVGPERLPKLASEAASLVRRIQRISQTATAELRENLGPGFENLQPSDLNPKTFIRKQINDALEVKDEQKEQAEKEERSLPPSNIDPDLL
jgi:sec-independent protein translocase protein TatB